MKETKSLLANTSSLFVIQIASYILPLILLPYLTRVLGVQNYGLVAFGLSFVALAGIVTDYGFDLYAPLLLSKNRGNRAYIKRLVGTIFACKVLLFTIASCTTLAFAYISETYSEHRYFFILLLLPILGNALQPNWFYQGMERMATITLYFLASRIMYVLCVLTLVTEPADYVWVPISSGIAQIGAALIALALMVKTGYAPSLPKLSDVYRTLGKATEYFSSRAAVATYTSGATFFLGLVSNPQQVAYYSAAEQLYRGAQGLFSPLAQSLYPYMARSQDRVLFKKVLVGSILTGCLGIVIGVLTGQDILNLIFGQTFTAGYSALQVFLVVLAINIPSVLLGYPYLGALGYGSFVNLTVIVAGLIQIAILITLHFLALTSVVHVALSVLVAETIVLLMRVKKCTELNKAGSDTVDYPRARP
jgi:PST family polysaccharide transporter